LSKIGSGKKGINNLKKPEQVEGFNDLSVARSAVKILGDYQDLTSVAVPS
jgi:hypothetical protein